MPGCYRIQGIIEKAVKVNGSVLVPFRHKDVRQAPPLHLVAAPLAQPLDHFPVIVSVDLLRGKCQRNEPLEGVGEGDFSNLRPGSPHAPFPVLRFRFVLVKSPRLAGLRFPIVSSFPAWLPKIRAAAADQVINPALIAGDLPVMSGSIGSEF